MADVRRINLCFDLEKPEHSKAYEIILGKSSKTDFVVECVLTLINKDCIISKDLLAGTIKQVLTEMNCRAGVEDALLREITKDKEQLPQEVFDMIDNL